MNELVEFLLARIAEDDALFTVHDSRHSTHWSDAPGTYSETCPTCRQLVYGSYRRGLAECEAKRRIVEGIRDATNGPVTEYYIGPVMTTDDVLALLALPYADHPEYREEWRP